MNVEHKSRFFHSERVIETLNIFERETDCRYHEIVERMKMSIYQNMFKNGIKNHLLFDGLSLPEKIKMITLLFRHNKNKR